MSAGESCKAGLLSWSAVDLVPVTAAAVQHTASCAESSGFQVLPTSSPRSTPPPRNQAHYGSLHSSICLILAGFCIEAFSREMVAFANMASRAWSTSTLANGLGIVNNVDVNALLSGDTLPTDPVELQRELEATNWNW